MNLLMLLYFQCCVNTLKEHTQLCLLAGNRMTKFQGCNLSFVKLYQHRIRNKKKKILKTRNFHNKSQKDYITIGRECIT